jgi:hypothetical protein
LEVGPEHGVDIIVVHRVGADDAQRHAEETQQERDDGIVSDLDCAELVELCF